MEMISGCKLDVLQDICFQKSHFCQKSLLSCVIFSLLLFLMLTGRSLCSGLFLCLRDYVKEVVTSEGEVVAVASAVLLALLNSWRRRRRVGQVGCHTEDGSSFVALLLHSRPIGKPFWFWKCRHFKFDQPFLFQVWQDLLLRLMLRKFLPLYCVDRDDHCSLWNGH